MLTKPVPSYIYICPYLAACYLSANYLDESAKEQLKEAAGDCVKLSL